MASLTEIAEGVLANAKRLDAYTASKGLPPTSFKEHTLDDLPEDLEECRKSLIDSTQTLKRLAQGPVGLYMEMLFMASPVPSPDDLSRLGSLGQPVTWP